MKLTGTNRSIGLIALNESVTRSGKSRVINPNLQAVINRTRMTQQIANAGKSRSALSLGVERIHAIDRECVQSRFAPARHSASIDGLVAMAGAPTPDPIPNSAVKAPSADGTAS